MPGRALNAISFITVYPITGNTGKKGTEMDLKIAGITLSLNAVEATQLHMDIENMLRDAGVSSAEDRTTRPAPILYDIFDKLYNSGLA
jgi:hypothetical protein